MADKKILEPGSGLGDISDLMHNQSVSDLSWLSVDEDMYRAAEALPKQNLDIIPELQTALTYEDDERVPSLILMRPHTIVNQNPLDRPSATLRAAASGLVRNRVAKYVIAGLDARTTSEKLQFEFSPEDLRAAVSDVQPILDERGLLGNVYVNAEHFPRCAQEGSDRKFVANAAPRALFVLAKEQCTNCVHNKNGVCASFKKRIVDEIPYTQKTFAHYAVQLNSENRLGEVRISSSTTDQERKEAIRVGFLRSPVASRGEPIQTIQHHPKPASVKVTAEDVRSFWVRRLASSGVEEMPGPLYLKAAKQLMLGTAELSILSASSNPEVRKLAREYGILGHTYVDMDAFGGCRSTLSFVRMRSLTPDFILRRSASCSMCKDASDGACAELRQITEVVASRPEPSKTLFASALQKALLQGRITQEQVSSALSRVSTTANWATLIAQANLIQPQKEAPKHYEGPQISFHHGAPGRELGVSVMQPEEVRKTISHLMNTGLAGKKLQLAVLSRYSRSDLAQVPEVGQILATDEGIQGEYFIDPTAYADYGAGCIVGAKHFRKRGAPYVLASVKCTGCTLQTAPGWCSKYSKPLIRHVPTEIRSAASSRRALRMVQENPPVVENPVEKYELSSELNIDLNGSKSRAIEVVIQPPHLTD